MFIGELNGTLQGQFVVLSLATLNSDLELQ